MGNFKQDFKILCTLKGLDDQALPLQDYQHIKQLFLDYIERADQAGFYFGEEIKIKFSDDENIIFFGYTPEEVQIIFDSKELAEEVYDRSYGVFEHESHHPHLLYKFHYYLSHHQVEEIIATLHEEHVNLPRENLQKKNRRQVTTLVPSHPKNTFIDLLKHIYNHEEVKVCIANEVHHHVWPKKAIMQALPEFINLNITAIYSEFFCVEQQALLDNYFKGDTDALPIELAKWCQYFDKISACTRPRYNDVLKIYEPRNSKHTYTELFITAKRQGIARVIALDSFLTRNHSQSLRVEIFNQQAFAVYQQETQGERAFFHVGFDHGFTGVHQQFKNAIGLADLIQGSYSIYIRDEHISQKSTLFFGARKTKLLAAIKNPDADAFITFRMKSRF